MTRAFQKRRPRRCGTATPLRAARISSGKTGWGMPNGTVVERSASWKAGGLFLQHLRAAERWYWTYHPVRVRMAYRAF